MITSTTGLIVATTSEIEGWPVHEYFGIVSAEATMSTSPTTGRPALTLWRRCSWAERIEERVGETRDRAITLMAQRALQAGATAIIAADIDYEIIRQPGSGDLLIVAASGTAVTLKRRTETG